MAKDEELEIILDRYLVNIEGPSNFGRCQDYNTNEFGAGYIKVYRILEAAPPHYSHDVKHLAYVGGFPLKEKSGKTPEEFMKEIKNGIAELVSE